MPWRDRIGSLSPARVVPDRWREWLWPWWHRLTAVDWAPWRRRTKVLLFTLVGAGVALALFGRVPADVGPFQATVSARPSFSGHTVVELAPLGDITFDTHRGPVRLEMRVDQLSYSEAERIAEEPELLEDLGDDVADEVGDAFLRLALRAGLVTLLGGMAGAFVARHDWRATASGAAVSALLLGVVGGGMALSFDAQAVSEPRYTGLLTMTDRAVGDVESILDRYDEYGEQLADLVGNVATLYLAAEGLPVEDPRDDTIRVLHVTDLHLSFHALDMMERLVAQFDVDVVADTGDSTDWGSRLEDRFVGELRRFDVPYLWVRGNHDSQDTQQAVEGLPNVTVLDDDTETVAGLTFWGVGDPRFTPDQGEDLNADDQREIAEEFAGDVSDMLGATPEPVDVALLHDPRFANDLDGEVPLVLAGHTHDQGVLTVGEDDGTTILVEGSTGGAGLRGLQGDEPEQVTASVLYFDAGSRELVAFDRVQVDGLGGGATIDRNIVAPSDEGEGEGDGEGDGEGGDADDESEVEAGEEG